MALRWRPGYDDGTGYVPGRLVLLKTQLDTRDADANAYMAAVEAADGQSLELGVRLAITNFVIGCKADGIWNAIKACCILSGARTQAGALVPLVGSAPTLLGTAGGWTYDRKTGTKGNGANNAIDANRSSDQGPQDSAHVAFYIGALGGGQTFFSNGNVSVPAKIYYDTASSGQGQINSTTSVTSLGNPSSAGFVGFNRSASNAWQARINGTTTTRTTPSSTTLSTTLIFQARRNNTTGAIELARTDNVFFYSIGESLDLALLDARVTVLSNAFAAAIPS